MSCLTLSETVKVLSKGYFVIFPPAMGGERGCSVFLSTFLLRVFHFTGVYWHLTVVFICIFLMTYDVEHLIMCLWAMCIFSGKQPFRSNAL